MLRNTQTIQRAAFLRWTVNVLIGVYVAAIAFLVAICIENLNSVKFHLIYSCILYDRMYRVGMRGYAWVCVGMRGYAWVCVCIDVNYRCCQRTHLSDYLQLLTALADCLLWIGDIKNPCSEQGDMIIISNL